MWKKIIVLWYTEWSVHGGNTICGLAVYRASLLWPVIKQSFSDIICSITSTPSILVRCYRPYNSCTIPQQPRSVKFSLHKSKLCRASPASLTNETCQGVGPSCFPQPLYSNRRGENVLGGFYEGGSHDQRPKGWAGWNQWLSSHYAGNLKTKGVSGAARAQCEWKVESPLEKGCAGAQRLKSRGEDRWSSASEARAVTDWDISPALTLVLKLDFQ